MPVRLYLVFRTTHETLKAEAALASAAVAGKLVARPAAIHLDCGLAVRIDPGARVAALAALDAAHLTPRGVVEL